MADGSVVIGVELDTAAFSASAARMEGQIMTLGSRLNASLTASLAGTGTADGMSAVFAGITASASAMAQTLAASMRTAAANAITAFTGAGWSQAGTAAGNALSGGIRAGSGSISIAVRDAADTARTAFSGGSWSSVGTNMMSGIASGIRSAGAEVIAAIRAVSEQTEFAVKDYFQIQSPSVTMRDEVGVMISRGIAEGITGGASFVEQAVSSLYGGTRESLTGTAGNARPVTQNIYLRDSDTSPYRTARRIKRESEAAARL